MVNFIQKTLDIGQILPNSKTEIEFPYEGEKSQIVHVEPECNCTANMRVEDGKIVGTFTESDDAHRQNATQQFPSGLWPIHKSLTVYYNDGLDLKVMTPNGILFNPNKKQEILTFHGQVKFKGE